uniref:Structural maintenance of chromosomes protein 4 n=1 Tax=Zea mays TaxID=4577 RepID=A0A804PX46_MAIZE
MMSMFKEIEKKVFVVQEEYKKTQEMIDNHKVELDKTKEEYTKLKKAMDELRATEVDAEYKLQDTKKLAKEWEMKVKTFKKRLDEIHIMLLNTWISMFKCFNFFCNFMTYMFSVVSSDVSMHYFVFSESKRMLLILRNSKRLQVMSN